MAKLSETQLKRVVERERQKQEAVRKKMEIQQKKELYGENWKQIEQEKLQFELEVKTGSETAPKIFNSVDLNTFFQPINLYKDEEGEVLKADFQEYEKTEKKYKKAIEDLDKKIKEYSDGVLEEAGTISGKTIKDKGMAPEKEKTNKSIKARNDLNMIVSKHFNRFVPIYDKHVCSCCGKPLKLDQYFKVYDPICSDRVDQNGEYHMWVCRECCYKLFAWLYNERANKDLELTTKYMCAYLNVYFDIDVFDIAKQSHNKSGRMKPFFAEYMIYVNRTCPGKTFFDSPFLSEAYERTGERVGVEQKKDNDAPYDWDREDVRNRQQVLKMVGYDPFEWESDENKKILYKDLLNILEPGMENDLVKFQAAIQIVMSFFKVRQMNKKQFEMERDGASIADQKALSDLKDKELKSITSFSRDNGFAERYATAKAKGENTFTGIVNKMNEAKFENAVMNRYDIETSATIQQAADASFKAIFSQLSLGESEVWKIAQDQLEELRKLRKENSDLEEKLRKAKYELAKINLEEKERQANIGLEEY